MHLRHLVKNLFGPLGLFSEFMKYYFTVVKY